MNKNERWYWWQAILTAIAGLPYADDERQFFLSWLYDFPKDEQARMLVASAVDSDSYAEMSTPDPLDGDDDDLI